MAKKTLGQKLGQFVFNSYVKNEIKTHTLSYLFWECTLRCNFACRHCGSDCHKDYKIPDMKTEDFLKVLDNIKTNINPDKLTVVLTGGEPTERNDLVEIGKEIQKRGYYWGMVTNGWHLTPEYFRELRNAGMSSITLSLDGFKEEHDWMRGKKGSFDRVVDALKYISVEENFIYDIVSCVHQRNLHYLPELKDFLVEQGVKKWRLFSIIPIGRAANDKEMMVENKDLIKLLDYIKEFRKEDKIDASYGCEGYLSHYENKVRDGFYFCRAGINISSVLANGDIGACPNINSGFVQGNIYKDDFSEIWKNKYDIYRDKKQLKTGICKDCKHWNHCLGNSMHLRLPNHDGPIRCHYREIEDSGN